MAKKRIDKFVIFVRIFDGLVWIAIFAALTFFDKAKPEQLTVLDVRYNKQIREYWQMNMVYSSIVLFALAAMIAFIGILINIGALGDRKHKLSMGMVIGLIFSIAALTMYYMNFFS